MLRIVLALMLLSSAALAQPPSNSQGEQSTPESVNVVGDSIVSIAESVEAIAEHTDPQNYTDPKENALDPTPAQFAAWDLGAQNTMADYTRRIYWATRTQAGLGVLTFFALVVTIIQTTKIVRQDRAWMMLASDANTSNVKDGAGRIISITQMLNLTNAGKTPALNFRYLAAEFDHAPTEEEVTQKLVEMRKLPSDVVGQGQSVVVIYANKRDAIDEIIQGKFVCLYVCCEYETIYGEKYRMESSPRVFFEDWTEHLGKQNILSVLRPHNSGMATNRITKIRKRSWHIWQPK